MRKIIVTVGCSGSGKTTWATNFIEKNEGYLRVNRDAIRMQITASNSKILIKELEKLVSKILDEQVRTILNDGYNVIIDNTHLQKKYIDEILMKYNHLAEVRLVFFDKSASKCKNGVMQRDGFNTNVDYIDRQAQQYKKLREQITDLIYPVTNIKYKCDKKLPECIICDLDGTVSLYGNKNAFDRDFENDDINKPLVKVISGLCIDNDWPYDLIFFSGRNRKFRKQTEQFLNKALGVGAPYQLYMRDEKDMRRDSIVKMEMFENYIKGKYNPICVFDDRLQVIEEVWNKLGLFVFNCNQENKRF